MVKESFLALASHEDLRECPFYSDSREAWDTRYLDLQLNYTKHEKERNEEKTRYQVYRRDDGTDDKPVIEPDLRSRDQIVGEHFPYKSRNVTLQAATRNTFCGRVARDVSFQRGQILRLPTTGPEA
jgi:hypothetical protein